MKRCPQCNRVEADDSLVFCCADGVAAVYGIAGKDVDANGALGGLMEVSKRRHRGPNILAVIYARRNDKEQAFEWLRRACYTRSFAMTQLKLDAILDSLRSDRRLKRLVKRTDLPAGI